MTAVLGFLACCICGVVAANGFVTGNWQVALLAVAVFFTSLEVAEVGRRVDGQ